MGKEGTTAAVARRRSHSPLKPPILWVPTPTLFKHPLTQTANILNAVRNSHLLRGSRTVQELFSIQFQYWQGKGVFSKSGTWFCTPYNSLINSCSKVRLSLVVVCKWYACRFLCDNFSDLVTALHNCIGSDRTLLSDDVRFLTIRHLCKIPFP